MKNKRVKQMICSMLELSDFKHLSPHYFYKYTNHYFSINNKPTVLITKYWKKDGDCAGINHHKFKKVSLTGAQLKGNEQ